MTRRTPRVTRTDTLFPDTTLFRSETQICRKLRQADGRIRSRIERTESDRHRARHREDLAARGANRQPRFADRGAGVPAPPVLSLTQAMVNDTKPGATPSRPPRAAPRR